MPKFFADVSISHARPSNGLGHYYCDWFCNPYVYQRFEGLLLAALVSGDPWWFETAKAMADYCVRAWKDGEPQDGGVDGTLGGVQYRSAYIAKMLLRMYEVTGDSQYVRHRVPTCPMDRAPAGAGGLVAQRARSHSLER